jgi:CelD/BcsL family acetyltransferase involved in cellulose biosynthesis
METTEPGIRAEVVRPSALGAAERAVWHQMLEASPCLQRAFFTPAFALACEQATGLAYIAVLHTQSTIRGFLPFQYRSGWHRRIRLAHRIGGGLSDNAGLVAWPDFRTTTSQLVRLCGLASLNLSHILEGQERFGLAADWSDVGYVSDLREGPDAYFAELLGQKRHLVRDTERQQRKLRQTYGEYSMRETASVNDAALLSVVTMKRQQYRRTQVRDVFEAPETMRLMEILRERPAQECMLVLASLQAGDKVLAQHLGLRHRGVLSWWFPAYDVSAQSVSPGRLLLWEIIRNSAASGINLIDYGAGEAQYKRQFSTGSLRIGRAIWSASNARAVLARAWQSIEWRLPGQHKPKAEQS